MRARLLGWALSTVAALFALGACDVYNYDAGGHIAKGKWILEHHELPRPEVFITSKEPGFIYHDRWLFQVTAWIVYSAGGWAGLTLVKIGFLCTTFGLLWIGARPAGPAACAFASLLAMLLMYERWDIRSELSVYLFVSAAIALAGDCKTGKWIWLAPAVVAIGINTHALVLLAPCLIAMAAVAALTRPETRGNAKRLALAAGASFVALGCNPHGYNVIAVPFEYLLRYRKGPDWYKGWITEMAGVTVDQPWMSVSMAAVWFVVPLATALLALNWKRARAFDVGLLLLGALVGFSYRRNVAVAGLLLLPVIARNLHELAGDLAEWLKTRDDARLSRALGIGAPAALGIATFLMVILPTTDLWAVSERSSRRAGWGISHITLPVDACDFLDREGFAGNAFVNWDIGAYYTLRRFPASTPTMNSEGDWSLVSLGEYNDVTRRPAELFDAYARKYSLELAVLSHQSADTRDLILVLSSSSAWALVHRDECAVVFARRGGANARQILRFAPGPGLVAPFGTEPRKIEGGVWPWNEGRRRAEAVRQFRIGNMLGLFGEAEERACYQRAIAGWAGYPEAHQNLGVCLARAREPGAEEELREAIRLAPRYAKPRRNLSVFCKERGDLDAAERVLSEGIEEIEDADLLTDLGKLRLERGLLMNDRSRLQSAAELARRALAVRPGHAEATKLLQDVQKALDESP